MSKNISHLAGRDQNKDLLLHHLKETSDSPNLQSRQEKISSLTEEYFASEAQLTSAASFYDLTCGQNSGKKVFVCNGTSCLLGGQQHTLIEQLRQHTAENQIGEISCQGRCYNPGSFMYQGKTYSGLEQTDLEKLFNAGNKVGDGTIPAFNLAEKSLLIDSEEEGKSESDLELFYQRLTQYLDQPKKIIEEVSAALLRGRGGAGFPFFQKLLACAQANADEKFVIVNADEGDPGAYSDRYLLEKHPHLILFGCLAAGLAIGAKRAYLYIRGEYPESIQIIKNNVRDLRNLGRSSGQISQFINDFEFVIVEGQGAYICGEETALINSIEGQRPEVRIKPPYPVQHGLFNKPTLVSNVETLANIWWILSYGGKAYANIGTKASTGTKLISINHQFARPGVYEIDMGMPLSAFLKKWVAFVGK